MIRDIRIRRLVLGGVAALPLWLAAGCAARGPATASADAGPRGPSEIRSPPAAHATGKSPALPPEAIGARYLLLGELHDNPGLHRLRLEWLQQLVVETRFALAMEQFDTAMQGPLDAARAHLAKVDTTVAATTEADATEADATEADATEADATEAVKSRRLAEAAGFSFDGWDWALYEPVVAFALRHELPLVAANLSNTQTAEVARGQAVSIDSSPPAGWSEADAAAMRSAIADGHCGLLPDSAVSGMVRAQLARDRTMAQAACEARRSTGLPVVLLAGNGHVRADIGVPRHLAECDPGASIVTIAIGEGAEPPAGRFDAFWRVAPVERPDPCAALRERFGGHRR